jgi:hypothetical protein
MFCMQVRAGGGRPTRARRRGMIGARGLPRARRRSPPPSRPRPFVPRRLQPASNPTRPQCEQTQDGTGCTTVGVCGKTPLVAGLQVHACAAPAGMAGPSARRRAPPCDVPCAAAAPRMGRPAGRMRRACGAQRPMRRPARHWSARPRPSPPLPSCPCPSPRTSPCTRSRACRRGRRPRARLASRTRRSTPSSTVGGAGWGAPCGRGGAAASPAWAAPDTPAWRHNACACARRKRHAAAPGPRTDRRRRRTPSPATLPATSARLHLCDADQRQL